MYCGDETGAFVGDCGLTSCRFGFAGEDCPKLVVPSYVKSKGECDAALSSSTFSLPSPDAYVDLISYPPTSIYGRSAPVGGDEGVPPSLLPDERGYVEHANGLITSFTAWEILWEGAMDALKVRSDASGTAHPVLVVEDFCQNNKLDMITHIATQRQTMLELLFEKWDAPAVYLAPAPMLQAFSMGRQTALVFDMGAGGCRATPVVDGYVCGASQFRCGRGGEWLSEMQYAVLQRNYYHNHRNDMSGDNLLRNFDQSLLERKRTGSRKTFPPLRLLREAMYEIKTDRHVTVSPKKAEEDKKDNGKSSRPNKKLKSGGDEEGKNNTNADRSENGDSDNSFDDDHDAPTYELPDGTEIDLKSDVGKTLCNLPDLLFCDDPIYSAGLSSSPTVNSADQKMSTAIQKLIHASISSMDVDSRKELCGNILLCGSHSMFPGLDTRLSAEITAVTSTHFKCRVVAPLNSVERQYASWIGGSVLASLGSFQQLWLSKAEYTEYGAALCCSERFA